MRAGQVLFALIGQEPSGMFVVNRDIGAGMNMIAIALCMARSAKRPALLRKQREKFEKWL